MIVSQDYWENVLLKRFSDNKILALKVTNECPVACEHCRENASMENKGVMTKEVFDEILRQICENEPREWIVCLQGGEAILYPDMCEYIIKKCKENRIMTNMYSSGWWYKECDKYIQKIMDWHPDIMCLSINDWSISKIGCGLEHIDKIASYFTSMSSPILLYSEVNLDGEKWSKKCKYQTCTIAYELAPVGRAKNLIGQYSKDGKTERWMSNDYCSMSGFEIGVDGTIWPNCCMASAGACNFGNIFDCSDKITQLLDMIKPNYCLIKDKID